MGWVAKSRGYKSVIVDDDGLISAEVCGPGHAKHARLMAAAPAMLAMLQEWSQAYAPEDDSPLSWEALNEVYTQTLALIEEAV